VEQQEHEGDGEEREQGGGGLGGGGIEKTANSTSATLSFRLQPHSKPPYQLYLDRTQHVVLMQNSLSNAEPLAHSPSPSTARAPQAFLPPLPLPPRTPQPEPRPLRGLPHPRPRALLSPSAPFLKTSLNRRLLAAGSSPSSSDSSSPAPGISSKVSPPALSSSLSPSLSTSSSPRPPPSPSPIHGAARSVRARSRSSSLAALRSVAWLPLICRGVNSPSPSTAILGSTGTGTGAGRRRARVRRGTTGSVERRERGGQRT
jgi:hypothetical protein